MIKTVGERLGKFLNIYVLLAVNLVIIAAAELIGNGWFFYETGLIHLIGIVFIFLVILIIFTRYSLQDRIIKNFLQICLIAFGIFSITHIIECFAACQPVNNWKIVDFEVMAFYFVGLFALFIATETILRAYRNQSAFKWQYPILTVFLFAMISIVFLANSSVFYYFYAYFAYLVLNSAIGILVITRTLKIGKILPLLSGFVRYFNIGIIFVVLASLFEFFEFFGLGGAINEVQTIYLAHFSIFFGMSFIFLGFGKLLNLGGIYQNVDEVVETGGHA